MFVTPGIEVTANRLKTLNALSPGKISVFDKNFITSLNSSNVSDVLNMISGSYIKDYGYNTGIKTISLNGTQSEHTQIMFNGVKLNSPQNSMYDLSLLNTDDITEVEILNGGSSALYGSEAVGGVINIISGDFTDKPFNILLKTELGSFGFQKYNVNLKGKYNKFSYYISGAYESSVNNYSFNYFDGFTIKELKRKDSGLNRNSLYSSFLFSGKYFVNGYISYNYLNRKIPPSVVSLNSLSSLQKDNNIIGGFKISNDDNDAVHFNLRVDYNYGFQKFSDPNTASSRYPVNSFYKLHSFINSGDVTINNTDHVKNLSGYELGYSTMISNETKDARQLHFALFNTLQYEPLKWLRVYPSVRFDHYSNINKNVFSSKIGINISPFYSKYNSGKASMFSVKSSAGSNYKVPSFNDLYWNGLGNTELKPEHSFSFDAGVYYSFWYYSLNTIELTYTHIDTKDRIVWNPDAAGIWKPSNIGRVLSRSFDISYRNRSPVHERFTWDFSIGYNISSALKRSENYPGDPTFNRQLIYIPKELAKSYLLLTYNSNNRFLKNISLNLFYSFAGKRYTDMENLHFAKYYDLFDANISVSFHLYKVETNVKFAVNNLLNKEYEVMQGYPMPFRNYKVQFSFKY